MTPHFQNLIILSYILVVIVKLSSIMAAYFALADKACISRNITQK